MNALHLQRLSEWVRKTSQLDCMLNITDNVCYIRRCCAFNLLLLSFSVQMYLQSKVQKTKKLKMNLQEVVNGIQEFLSNVAMRKMHD